MQQPWKPSVSGAFLRSVGLLRTERSGFREDTAAMQNLAASLYKIRLAK